MKTIGLPISHKENENRRTLVPEHLKNFDACDGIFVEKGYGQVLGIPDEVYRSYGCHICNRSEVLEQDIICDPKIGDADYLSVLQEGQTIFGWIHATQNADITDKLLERKLTAFAWEKMYSLGRHVFWRNNELAGEAAVLHSFQCFGEIPYEAKVAVIGRGNTARGAMRSLERMGAKVVQYDRHTEELFRQELNQYDAVINCVLWDVMRKDHIISRRDLSRMKPGSMIVDISCDRNGGIETSIPTTIDDPIYYVDGICHYVVDHTPTIFYKTFSRENSRVVVPYFRELMNDRCGDTLQNALIVQNGQIVDQEIIRFQNR